jgi:6-pyruvoyltetrahydropterin/6-carboxytetrahydropterin synthase
LQFAGEKLDEKNWIVDFGGLKELKGWLKTMFDHTYLVAKDDPELDTFIDLAKKDLVDLRVVDAVGCERFAELVFDKAQDIVQQIYGNRCWVESVTVREHESNSATCRRA